MEGQRGSGTAPMSLPFSRGALGASLSPPDLYRPQAGTKPNILPKSGSDPGPLFSVSPERAPCPGHRLGVGAWRNGPLHAHWSPWGCWPEAEGPGVG